MRGFLLKSQEKRRVFRVFRRLFWLFLRGPFFSLSMRWANMATTWDAALKFRLMIKDMALKRAGVFSSNGRGMRKTRLEGFPLTFSRFNWAFSSTSSLHSLRVTTSRTDASQISTMQSTTTIILFATLATIVLSAKLMKPGDSENDSKFLLFNGWIYSWFQSRSLDPA